MAKKKISAIDVLTGREQLAPEQPIKETYEPLIPGETYKGNISETLNRNFVFTDKAQEKDPILPYSGRYYKGSGLNPYQSRLQGENQPGIIKTGSGLTTNFVSIFTKAGSMLANTGILAYDMLTDVTVPGLYQKRRDLYGTATPNAIDNVVSRSLDYFENDILEKQLLPVYTGHRYESDNVFKKIFSADFIAKDAFDAISFTLASLLIAKGTEYAFKGTKLATPVNKGGNIVKELSARGKLLTNVTANILQTSGESLMEASEFTKNARQEMALRDYGVDYKDLGDEERQAINKEIAPLAQNVFYSNLAILAGPNMIMNRFFLGSVKDTGDKLRKEIIAGTLNPKTLNKARQAIKFGSTGFVSEGWEEGSQKAVQDYEESRLDKSNTFNRAKGYMYQFASNFFDTEGQSAMLLGGLIGLTGGATRGIIDSSNQQKYVKEYKDIWDRAVNKEFKVADNIFPSNLKWPFKQYDKERTVDGVTQTIKSVIPEEGPPVIDFDKTIKTFNAIVNNEEIYDNLMMAALSGDEVQEKFFTNLALAQLFYTYATNQAFKDIDEAYDMLLKRNPFDKLNEDEDIKALNLDFDYMHSRLNDMRLEWKLMEERLRSSEDLRNNDPEYLTYNALLRKSYFYNKVKLRWLVDVDDKISDKEQVRKLTEDATDLIEMYDDKVKRSQLYERYKESEKHISDLMLAYKTEKKKDPNSLETKKYEYLIKEEEQIFGSDRTISPFTIARDIGRFPDSIGLKHQHYMNIAADAMVSLRLQSAIEEAKQTGNLDNIINILTGPAEGTIDTRGKFDVTQEDIDKIRDILPDVKRIHEINTRDTIAAAEAELEDLEELQQSDEAVSQEEYEERTFNAEQIILDAKELDRRFTESEKLINNFEGYKDGRGLLNYADGISKAEKDDDVFLRKVADEPVERTEDIIAKLKNNPEYNNKREVESTIEQLKEYRELYTGTSLKDRLDPKRKAFKGYLESLDKAIDNLTNNVLKQVTENYFNDKNLDKKSQINRNKKRFQGIGITFNDKNEPVFNETIKKLIEAVIGTTKLDEIIKEAQKAAESGDEYQYHEIFVYRILNDIKNHSNKDAAKNFVVGINKLYGESIDRFRNEYYTVFNIPIGDRTGVKNTLLDWYAINPRRVFLDLVKNRLSRRIRKLEEKTPVDEYFNNNDILELYEGLKSSTDTGYEITKDQLLRIVTMQIETESLQDVVEYLDSDYSIEDAIRLEKEMFEEGGLAPTGQQLNAIRKAAFWFKSKLKSRSTNELDKIKFLNWLFIKGNAGTGKTQVVIKYILKLLGINTNEVLFLAPHEEALSMLSKQALTTNKPMLISEINEIPDSIKVIIIDEVAAISDHNLYNLSSKLAQLNKTGFRVIALGDPSQISSDETATEVVSEPTINQCLYNQDGMQYITNIDPLTIKKRSNWAELNEFQEAYENNRAVVTGIPVYASSMIGTPSDGVHIGKVDDMLHMLNVNNELGREKLIVVFTKKEKEELKKDPRYTKYANSIKTVSEIGGIEKAEVYINLNRNLFGDIIQFNKAFYTAISRSQNYIFIVDHNNDFNQRYKQLTKTVNESTELNDEFKYRNKFEATVIGGKNTIPKKKKKEDKKEEQKTDKKENNITTPPKKDIKDIEKEDEEDDDVILPEDDDTGEDWNDTNYPENDGDNNGSEEDDSDINSPVLKIEVEGDNILHEVKYVTGTGIARIKPKEGEFKTVLKETGNEVIYVKTPDITEKSKRNYTVHILGQAYNINGQPQKDRYIHLGIVSDEELDSDTQIAKILTTNAENSSYYADVNINQFTKDTTISVKEENRPYVILASGILKEGSPLTYEYDRSNKPTMSGRGFINDLYNLIARKLFNLSPEPIKYQIRIFNKKELAAGGEYAALIDKNLYPGVPYLIIDRLRKDNISYQKTQFIRLNPVNITKNNEHIIALNKFYDAIENLEKIIKGKAEYGTDQFNNIIKLLKENYEIDKDGKTVKFDRNNVTWDDYKKKMSFGDVAKLQKREFEILINNTNREVIDDIITGIYGPGQVRVRIGINDKEQYLKDNGIDLETKEDDQYIYSFIDKEKYAYVFRVDKNKPKSKGEYVTDIRLKAGHGVAQHALNVIAQANLSIDDFTLRVRTAKDISKLTGERKKKRYVSTGKSLLTTKETSIAYYLHLKRILNANDYEGLTVIDDQGNEIIDEDPIVDEDNYKDIERDIISKDYATEFELERLRLEHTSKPFTKEVLRNIITFDKGKKHHRSLRTPLPRLHINKIGQDTTAIQENIDELESLLQTNLKDIRQAKAVIAINKPTTATKIEKPKDEPEVDEDGFTAQERRLYEQRKKIQKSRNKIVPPNIDNDTAKKLELTVKEEELGKARPEWYIRLLIKRFIPNIKSYEIEFIADEIMKRDEQALGVFKKGIIKLSQDPRTLTTKEIIAIHEVFHKIFNEYLTPQERAKAEELAKKEFPDYNDYVDIEDCLAMKFMAANHGLLKTLSDFFVQLFKKIKRIINAFVGNIDNVDTARFDTIDDLFGMINTGMFRNRLVEYDGVTKQMIRVINKFGSIAEYVASLDLLLRRFSDYRKEGVNGYYYNHKELRKHVLDSLKKEKKKAQKEYNKSKTTDNYIDFKRLDRTIEFYGELLNDLYPGFNPYNNGTYKSKNDDDWKDALREVRDATHNRSQWTENSMVNSEIETIDELKEFLSYVEVLLDKDDPYSKTFVSWRYVYVKLMSMFEGLSLDQGNELEQLHESIGYNKATEIEIAILEYLTNIYKSFTGLKTADDKLIDLKAKYLDENTFIYGDIDVRSIDSIHDGKILDGSIKKIERQSREKSDEFAKRISRITKKSTDEIKEYSKRYQYNKIWNMMVNHFNSHRQRDVKIGERKISYGSHEIRYINARGNAVTLAVRDNIIYHISSKFQTKNDIIIFNSLLKEWDIKYKNELNFVKEFLRHVGLTEYANSLNTNNAKQIKEDIIKTFEKLEDEPIGQKIDNIQAEDALKDENEAQETLQDDDKYGGVYTVADVLNRDYHSLTTHLSHAISLIDNLDRLMTSQDAKGSKRYNSVLTSFGHKNLFNIANTKHGKKNYGKTKLTLNKIYNNKFFGKNIFINGNNIIHRIIDDDGLKYDDYKGNSWSTLYKYEKRSDFNFRSFVLGFLSEITYSGNDGYKYIQYMCPNQRTYPIGVQINLLQRESLINAIKDTIKQYQNRDKALVTKYANYNPESFLGFDVLREVLEEKKLNLSDLNDTHYDQLALDIYNKLDEKSHELTRRLIENRTPFDSKLPKKFELFDNIVDRTLYPEFHLNSLPTNNGGYLSPLESWDDFTSRLHLKGINSRNAWEKGEEREYLIKEENINALVSLYFINNYVNGLHFAQTVLGDLAIFEGIDDITKRIALAFAPGRAGYINEKYGTTPSFNVAVVEDPVKDNNTIKTFLRSLLKGKITEDGLDELIKKYPEKGFKPGDSAGYILPESVDSINKGFSASYGNVLKPVYWHVGEDSVAVGVKYSLIVLTDELCEEFSQLGLLRDKMRNNKGRKIDQVVFESAVKVGKPAKLNDWYKLVNNKAIKFDPASQFLMDNNDFRIQQDPESDIEGEISYPMQLSYLLNIHGLTDAQADDVYMSFGKIIESNWKSFERYASSKRGLHHLLRDILDKTNRDDLKDILSQDIDINFPPLVDKLLIYYISTMYDRAVKTKFDGSKLILQSALGAQKILKSEGVILEKGLRRELEYKNDANGNPYAETILPEGILDPKVEAEIKKALKEGREPDQFFIYNGKLSKDALGFRLPSSGYHSSVVLKVVGFYPSKGTNVIIAPKMLVVLHGADFDIDSLSVLTRSRVAEYKKSKGEPIGYTWNETNKQYEFSNKTEFIDKIKSERIKRKVTEAYYLNRILENFISAATAPQNAINMFTPIDIQPLEKEKERILSYTGEGEKGHDLFNAIDQEDMHDLIFSGINSVGAFLASVKVFSFLHRAMPGEKITKLKVKAKGEEKTPAENTDIRFNGINYNTLVDIDYSNEKDYKGTLSGERFDTLENAAVDNLKLLILKYLNIDSETTRAYSTMVTHGIPFSTINNFIGQPILRYYTIYGNRDGGYLHRKLNNTLNDDSIKKIELTDEKMIQYLSAKDEHGKMKYTPKKLKELADSNYDKLTTEDKEFLDFQLAVYYQYAKLTHIGKEVGKMIHIINVIKGFPIKVPQIDFILDTARSIFGIEEGRSITKAGANGKIIDDTKSSFPYYIESFLDVNKHIFQALKVLEQVKQKIDSEFILYDPKLRSIADKIIANTNIQLDRDARTNKKLILDEFSKFIMTSVVDRSWAKPKVVTNKAMNEKITLTDINAFNKRFVDMVLFAQGVERVKMDEANKEGLYYPGNMFLNLISIVTDPISGKERIIFYGPSSMDNVDYNLYKQSFEELKDYDIIFDKNGEYKYEKLPDNDPKRKSGNYTTFQSLFVDYAILNYGMSHGMRNYSRILPPALYKERSDKIVKTLYSIKDLNDEQFNNVVEAFEAQIIKNYPAGLNEKNSITNNENVELIENGTQEVKGKNVPIYKGKTVEGIYYDRRFESDTVIKYPKWYIEKFNNTINIFRRITMEEEMVGLYVRIGHKNYNSMYSLKHIDDAINYNSSEQFENKLFKLKLRLVKGNLNERGYYINKYSDIAEGETILLSDYNDPGNIYAQPFIVKKKDKDVYTFEKEQRLKESGYFEKQNSYVDSEYNKLDKRLRSQVGKKGFVRVWGGNIIIQKDKLNQAREYYWDINRKEFNGLKVIHEVDTGSRIYLRIDKQLLGKFLYGRQLDVFASGYGIIDKIYKNKLFDKLFNTTVILEEEVTNKIDKLHETYDNKGVTQILDEMNQRATNKFHRLIISSLKKKLQDNTLLYRGHEEIKQRWLAKYNPSGYVVMDYNKLASSNRSIKDIDKILLHEFVHAVFDNNINSNDEFMQQIRYYMNIIIDNNSTIAKKYDQAFINEKEFAAEFFSNEEFYNDLSKINEYGEKRSIKDKIIDLIRWMLGLDRSKRITDEIEGIFNDYYKTPEYYELKDGKYYDKLGNEIKLAESGYSSIEQTKYLKDIVSEWADIYTPLDENGNEMDINKDAEGNSYRRITNYLTGWISFFRPTSTSRTIGEKDADQAWGSISKEEKLKIGSKEYTYDEYKKEKETQALQGIVRAKILHLFNKLKGDQLYNHGNNENKIKEEIQNTAYRDYIVVDSKGNKDKIQIALDPDYFNWFNKNIKDIYNVHGINILDNISAEYKQVMACEIPVANKLLGFSGTPDIILETPDGKLIIKDITTGRYFDKEWTNRLLKYGDQNRQIIDSPRDRKKMQIMMYAFMIKANPKFKDVKFRDLSIMYLPDAYYATEYDTMREVEVADFLSMIETFLKDKKALKEAGIDENVYEKLIDKKTGSPNLFNVSEYTDRYETKIHGQGAVSDYYQEKIAKDEIITKLLSNAHTPDQELLILTEELNRIMGKIDVNVKTGISDFKKLSAKDQELVKLINLQILQLYKDPDLELRYSKEFDPSVITKTIGSWADITDPHVQTFKKIATEQDHLYNIRVDHIKRNHDGLYRKVLAELKKEYPRLIINERNLNFNNYRKMFSWMYKDENYNGGIRKRLLIETDQEYKDLNSDIKREYITFLNDTYASYFEGPNAFTKNIATYIERPGGKIEPISIMDLYNEPLSDIEKFTYYRGWFPKPPKEIHEVVYDAGGGSYLQGYFDKKTWIDLKNRSFSYFYENNFYGRIHRKMVLPLQFIGNRKIEDAELYTLNPELQFDQFTKSIERKRFFDPVIAIGEATLGYLEAAIDNKGQPIYHELPKIFENLLIRTVLNKSRREELTRKPIRVNIGDEDKKGSVEGTLNFMRSWTSATLMWLKPFSGAGNGFNAMMLLKKDSIKGSISRLKFLGIDEDSIDYTLKDTLWADKMYFTDYIPSLITGKFEQNKIWLLLKKLRYLPDNFDFKSSDKYMLSVRNKVISESGMYMFHRLPEEYVSITTMLAQLRHMKHTSEINPNTGKRYTIFECYKEVKLDNGEWDVIWNPDIKARGVYKQGSGDKAIYKTITELLPQEIAHMKQVYRRLQGGYKKEEASAMEAYVTGRVFIQLKKYYPQLIMNAFASKRMEQDLGTLRKTLEKKDGEDVYVWMARWNEGRIWMLSKMAVSLISMGAKYPDYRWSQMEPFMKQNAIDAALTWGMWAVMYMAYGKVFGDDDKDDTLRLWYKMYLLDNFVQQYSPKELLKIGVQGINPVAFTRALQSVEGLATMMAAGINYTFGDGEDVLTKEGDVRGLNNFLKAVPIVASYQDAMRRVENSEGLSKWLQFDRLNKWR